MSSLKSYISRLKSNHRRILLIVLGGIVITLSSSTALRTYALSYHQFRPLIQAIPLNFPITQYPQRVDNEPEPTLTARGVVLLEPTSFKTLYSKNENEKLSPASITKLLTALTTLDTYSLDEVITVPKIIPEGQVMGLVEGEHITVKNLLYGLLVKSGNDAAIVLSSNEKIKSEDFVYSMNAKAKQLHMENTHFVNPTGLDADNHYSTPHDIALLGAAVSNHPVLSEIFKTKTIIVSDVEKKHWHELENVNLLLGEMSIVGIKTGYTEKANQCLLAYSVLNNKPLISVVLGSDDRFGETKSLLSWGYRVYSW